MKKLLFFILFPFLTFSQVQIGSNIIGEAELDETGRSVSLSNDGNIIAIGAPYNSGNGSYSGSVSIYENINDVWTLTVNIDGESSSDQSGSSVSLSSDGTIVAIGARTNDGNGTNSGHVRVYRNILGRWFKIGSNINGESSNDLSGIVSLSSDGSILAIGAPENEDKGHVSVYKNISEEWVQIGSDINGDTPGDAFGVSLSLSTDGSIIAIGAMGNDGNEIDSGHVKVYKNISEEWVQIGPDIEGKTISEASGSSVSLSSDGNIVAIGARYSDNNGEDSGHVSVYKNISEEWVQIGSDIDGESSLDYSGRSVSLSSDGSILAIGAPGNGSFERGHVRIYKNISDEWIQIGSDINGKNRDDKLGYSVSLSSDGSILAMGAPSFDTFGYASIYDLTTVLSINSFKNNYFSYYPNPVKNTLNIQLKNNLELNQVNIYNIQSQYLYSVKTSKIDMSNLSRGIYFIEVETNQGKSAKKIVLE